MRGDLYITGDPDSDELLNTDPLALLIGMLLDQQVAMETAFAGPLKISERAGTLDAAAIASFDPDAFTELFKATPGEMKSPQEMVDAALAHFPNDDVAIDDISFPVDNRGVYVLDGSLLPTAPGVNPQWTIMAMASLLAQKAVES